MKPKTDLENIPLIPAPESAVIYDVLIVEHNPDCRILIETVLRNEGLSVKTADTAMAAFGLLNTFHFRLITTDIRMPIICGFEFLAAVKEARLKTPVLAISANAFQTDKDAAIKAGFVDYLTKPFAINEMAARIKKLIV